MFIPTHHRRWGDRFVPLHPSRPSLLSPLPRALVLGVVVLLLAGLLTSGIASGQPSTREGVPSVEEADELRTQAMARNSRAQASLLDRELAFEAIQDSLDDLDQRESSLLTALTDARSDAIDLAVAAYVGGGEAVTEVELLLGPGLATDISWRRTLVVTQASNVSAAAENYSELAFAAGTEIHQLAISAQRAAVSRDAGLAEAASAAEHLAEVEELHAIAVAWNRSDIAVAEGRFGEAPAADWERLRMCEATGNYEAISKSGIYRGAYQFDRQTWRTVGGEGDPAAAPALEQDARARELYARRGKAPWPVCGRFLP